MPASELTADHVSQAMGWKCPMSRVVNAHVTTPGEPSRSLPLSAYGSSQFTNWFEASGRNAAIVAAAIARIQTTSTRVSLFRAADICVGFFVAMPRALRIHAAAHANSRAQTLHL